MASDKQPPADRPDFTGYAFPGMENIHNDIYPAISAAETPSLRQEGKVVLVTGASRGIGRAIAIQYAHAGVASLVLCARSTAPLDEVEVELKTINKNIRVLKFGFDVTDDDKVEECAKEVKAKEGRLDVLVNNAGYTNPWGPIAKSDPKLWWKTLEINVKAPFLFQRAFHPLLADTVQQHKTPTYVVHLTSIGAHMVGNSAPSAYLISKLALLRLAELSDVEYAEQGINVLSYHPGGVPTDMGLQEAALKDCEHILFILVMEYVESIGLTVAQI